MNDIKQYNEQQAQQFNDNDESGFKLIDWIFLFLKYWYLFFIFVILAFALAFLKNRSWVESFESSGTIIIDDSRSYGGSLFMQGFGVQSGYKNIDNQVIMLTSYDLISRVVDSIPDLSIDYVSKGRFKTRNLYHTSPIVITKEYLDPRAYGILFKIDLKSDGSFVITDEEGAINKNLKINGRLGVPVQHNLFFITIDVTTQHLDSRELYFRFRDKKSLVGDFMSRLNPNYVVDRSSVLKVSLTSETPSRDIDFINKLFDVFLVENLERKNDAANKTINFIDEQLNLVSDALAVSEGAMTEFRKSNQIVDLSTHSTEVLGKASQYDSQQTQLRLRENYLNYLANYLQTNLEAGSIVAPSSLGLNEPMLVSLVQQFNDVITQKDETNERNPLYRKYEREIASLKVSFNEVIKNMRASLEIEKADLNTKVATVQEEISALPIKEMELIGIERKYRVDDNYYTFFLQKRAEAAIQKASNSPDNNILDKARITASTNRGTKSKTTMTYLLIGLLIPALFVILKELLNTTIRDAKDIEKNSPYPLIGSIKHTNSEDPILASKRPRSAFTEMFRVIRTRVEFIVQRRKNIAILTTSAESGDGKTYFCTNLASVYGMSGKKTILVDMDIRKPSISNRFDVKDPKGVTNFIIGDVFLDDVITKIEGVNFDVLFAGTVPPNPGELIRSEKLKEMFNELRTKYDYIIVDTSPIGLVADAYSLAPIMDANLFIARSQKTNKGFFKKLTEQINNDKLSRFYIILNDVKTESASSGKYLSSYGYGYGYRYGYYGRKNKKAANQYAHYYEDDSEI